MDKSCGQFQQTRAENEKLKSNFEGPNCSVESFFFNTTNIIHMSISQKFEIFILRIFCHFFGKATMCSLSSNY